jgi:type I restriction enzyme M protein
MFDICLTNPPFGAVETDKKILDKYDLGKSRDSQEREILALERAIRLLKPNKNRAGIVLIEGLLNNKKYHYVRKYLRENIWIAGIIGLNYATFAGYGSKATTSILFFTRKETPDDGKQKDIFMGVCSNSGYSHSGAEIAGNELPEILLYFKKFLTEGTTEFKDKRVIVVKSGELRERLDPQHYISQVDLTKADIQSINTAKAKLQQDVEATNKVYDSLFNSDSSIFDRIKEWDSVEIGTLLKEYKAPEKVDPNKDYILLGVRGKGLGAFVKDPKKGNMIKAKTLYKLKQDLLIYNRLFAHRGSFAVLDAPSFAENYVSGEFPAFEALETKYNSQSLIKYLFFCCLYPAFVDEARKYSSGSTKMSRFRLNQKIFLKLKIRIPSNPKDLNALVQKMVEAFVAASKLRELRKSLDSSMEELKDKMLRMLPE